MLFFRNLYLNKNLGNGDYNMSFTVDDFLRYVFGSYKVANNFISALKPNKASSNDMRPKSVRTAV